MAGCHSAPPRPTNICYEQVKQWWVMQHILDYFCLKHISRYIAKCHQQFTSIEDFIEKFVEDVFVKELGLSDFEIIHMVETDYSRRYLRQSLSIYRQNGQLGVNYAPKVIRNMGTMPSSKTV